MNDAAVESISWPEWLGPQGVGTTYDPYLLFYIRRSNFATSTLYPGTDDSPS
jgi:hypothetical protein